MIITSVERDKKNKDRLSVYIDDKYAFSISEADYLSLNLYEKQEITSEDIRHIKENINFRAAKSIAVRYLSLKIRSEKEVRLRLENDNFDCGTIEKVIEDLKSLGYINDSLYVQKYVFDRSKLKPKSRRLLKLELLNKGLAEEVIDSVLSDWQVDDSVVAESLVKKKFGKYNLKDKKIMKRVCSFLQYRGFSPEIINGIINKINEGPGL